MSISSSSSSSSSSMPPPTSRSSFDSDGAVKELKCSITLRLLTEAVSIHPCQHKFNEEAAKILLSQGKPCALCKGPIIDYRPDNVIRALAICLLKMEDPSISKSPKDSAVVQKMEAECKELSYLVKPVTFKHVSGDWSGADVGHESTLRYYLSFKAIAPDSLITQFELSGYEDKSIQLRIDFLPHAAQELKKYLASFNIKMDPVAEINGFMVVKLPSEIKMLFSIIAKNNEIPSSHFDKIKAIVEKGML